MSTRATSITHQDPKEIEQRIGLFLVDLASGHPKSLGVIPHLEAAFSLPRGEILIDLCKFIKPALTTLLRSLYVPNLNPSPTPTVYCVLRIIELLNDWRLRRSTPPVNPEFIESLRPRSDFIPFEELEKLFAFFEGPQLYTWLVDIFCMVYDARFYNPVPDSAVRWLSRTLPYNRETSCQKCHASPCLKECPSLIERAAYSEDLAQELINSNLQPSGRARSLFTLMVLGELDPAASSEPKTKAQLAFYETIAMTLMANESIRQEILSSSNPWFSDKITYLAQSCHTPLGINLSFSTLMAEFGYRRGLLRELRQVSEELSQKLRAIKGTNSDGPLPFKGTDLEAAWKLEGALGCELSFKAAEVLQAEDLMYAAAKGLSCDSRSQKDLYNSKVSSDLGRRILASAETFGFNDCEKLMKTFVTPAEVFTQLQFPDNYRHREAFHAQLQLLMFVFSRKSSVPFPDTVATAFCDIVELIDPAGSPGQNAWFHLAAPLTADTLTFLRVLELIEFSGCGPNSPRIKLVRRLASKLVWPNDPSYNCCRTYTRVIHNAIKTHSHDKCGVFPLRFGVDDVCRLLDQSKLLGCRGELLDLVEVLLAVQKEQEFDTMDHGILLAVFVDVLSIVYLEEAADETSVASMATAMRCLTIMKRSRQFCQLALEFPPLMAALRKCLVRYGRTSAAAAEVELAKAAAYLLRLWSRMYTLDPLEKLEKYGFVPVLQSQELWEAFETDCTAHETLRRLQQLLLPAWKLGEA